MLGDFVYTPRPPDLLPSGAQGSTTSTKVTKLAESNGWCLLLCGSGLVGTELRDLVPSWRPSWESDQSRIPAGTLPGKEA